METRNKFSTFPQNANVKIGINGISLNFKRKTTGFGRYTVNLIQEFQNYPEFKFYVFVDRIFKFREIRNYGLNKNIVPILIPVPTFFIILRIFWTKYLLSIFAKLMGIEIFFTPDGVLPLFGFKKSIATIHDLAFLIHPETLSRQAYLFFRKNYKETSKSADIIITVSENSKNDIIKFYDLPERKVQVIYNGVGKYFFNDLEAFEKITISKKFELKKPYIFYLGTIEPRKNLVSVIKAFKKISLKYTDLLLVIGGLRGWLTEEIENEINNINNKESKIILTGNLTDSDYKYLLKNTEVFIYIPLYEGFGLPVLEAMASGCRVITSNTSSLPEVVGETCIKVAPRDIRSIVYNLDVLLSQKRNINEKAILRAANFTWPKSAEMHIRIIKSLIEKANN